MATASAAKKVVAKGNVKSKVVEHELSKEEKSKTIMDNMNAAALEAQEEFKALDKKVQTAMTAFFVKWYPKAGYKKLGKMIVGKPFINGGDKE